MKIGLFLTGFLLLFPVNMVARACWFDNYSEFVICIDLALDQLEKFMKILKLGFYLVFVLLS